MMLFIDKQRSEEQVMPPWYYGFTYRNWETGIDHYDIIPINYLIRWGMFIKLIWNNFRRKPGYIDKQICIVERKYCRQELKFQQAYINADYRKKFWKLINSWIEEDKDFLEEAIKLLKKKREEQNEKGGI
jgi:Holliday junction resolvase-like predicted endonuclease